MKVFSLTNTPNKNFEGYFEENEIGIDLHWIADNKEEAIQVVKTLLKYVENA